MQRAELAGKTGAPGEPESDPARVFEGGGREAGAPVWFCPRASASKFSPGGGRGEEGEEEEDGEGEREGEREEEDKEGGRRRDNWQASRPLAASSGSGAPRVRSSILSLCSFQDP